LRGLFVGISMIFFSTIIFSISFYTLNASRSDLNNASEVLDIELSDFPNIERVVTKTSISRLIGYKFVLNEMIEHPFMGYGYDISQHREELPVNVSGNPIGIHNVFLLFFLGGGMFGVIGSVLIYLKAVLTAISAMRIWSHEYSDSLLLMLSVSVMNFIFIELVQPHMHIRISWLLFSLLYLWVLEFRSDVKFGKTSNYTQGPSWM
jgi:O-antigen ligase